MAHGILITFDGPRRFRGLPTRLRFAPFLKRPTQESTFHANIRVKTQVPIKLSRALLTRSNAIKLGPRYNKQQYIHDGFHVLS